MTTSVVMSLKTSLPRWANPHCRGSWGGYNILLAPEEISLVEFERRPSGPPPESHPAGSRELAGYLCRPCLECGGVGRRGQAIHRLRNRHCRAEYGTSPPEGESSRCRPARKILAHLFSGHALRELRRARRAAQCSRSRKDAQEDHFSDDGRRSYRERSEDRALPYQA